MRCPDCNKFAAYDDGNEPEIESEDLSDDGRITIGARIYLTHDECGTELKEARFDLEDEVDEEALEAHKGDGHELSLNVDGAELTNRSDGKPGTPMRYRKTFYGVSLNAEVTCACGESLYSETLSDEMQASHMDELG